MAVLSFLLRATAWAPVLLLLILILATTTTRAQRFDCTSDSCVDRSSFVIKVIVHGTFEDFFWQGIKAAMEQAARDMAVQLDFDLYDTFDDFTRIPDDIRDTLNADPKPDALVVSIPDAGVEAAVKLVMDDGSIPVFGVNSGDQAAPALGLQGFVAMNERLGGQVAGENFERMIMMNNETAGGLGLYINDEPTNFALTKRFQGLTSVLPGMTISKVDILASLPFEDFKARVATLIQGCPFRIIQFASGRPLRAVIEAMEEEGCNFDATLVGAFDVNDQVYAALGDGKLAHTISQQSNLQGSLPIVMATLFATTGRRLADPMQPSEGVYLSGPRLYTRDNIPTDTIQTCENEGFPVCPNTVASNGEEAMCPCTDRTGIRLAAVTHGVSTDTFWDSVYAAMEQAASDFNVVVDMIRLEPEETAEIVHRKMANELSAVCKQNIDGLIVSIPSEIVAEALSDCLDLNIPIVSVNSGSTFSNQLGLQHHVGQLEFRAGKNAAKRMLAAGATQGLCTIHEATNVALIDRCAGMEEAFNETTIDGVSYLGAIEVPQDNRAAYRSIVESAIDQDGTWAGIGVLVVGKVQIPPILELQTDHSDLVIGSFDSSPELYQAIEDGRVLFGVSQSEYLQGFLPVALLTWNSYTELQLINQAVETGPNFVTTIPTKAELTCVKVDFEACLPLDPEPEEVNSSNDSLSAGAIAGISIACALVLFAVLFLLYRVHRLSAHIAKLEKSGHSIPHISFVRQLSSFVSPVDNVVNAAVKASAGTDSTAAGTALHAVKQEDADAANVEDGQMDAEKVDAEEAPVPT